MALLTSVVSVALSETVLYPFVAFMVGSFHLTDDPTKIGWGGWGFSLVETVYVLNS